MKLKHLKYALSSIQREFPSPKVEDLEQYPTSAHHLAALASLTAQDDGDIGEGCSRLHLGCGTVYVGH
jgi:predicted RNA methylase